MNGQSPLRTAAPVIAGAVAVALLASCGAMAGSDKDGDRPAWDFSAADTDGSGTLTAAELRVWHESWIDDRIARIVERLDDDGDGVLNEAEAEKIGRWHRHRHWHD